VGWGHPALDDERVWESNRQLLSPILTLAPSFFVAAAFVFPDAGYGLGKGQARAAGLFLRVTPSCVGLIVK
jgi:hypothetical protein